MSRSPFPGMDPYLERHWLDVHAKLAVYAADALNEVLPADLAATTEERVAVESSEDREPLLGPDVFVDSSATAPAAGGAATEGVVIEAPFRLHTVLDPVIERYVKVVESAGNRLLSVIEFISPTNKRGRGLRVFRRKRAALLASGVHVVEVDLVRAGNWRALMRPDTCSEDAESTYRVVIRTAGSAAGGYLFPITLRQPLPSVPIPLRPRDPVVRLDLQRLIDAVYARGRYAGRVRYDRPLRRALDPADAAWAEDLLRAAGKR